MKQAQSFMITSDNTTDLPPEFYAQHQLPIAHVDYTLDDICYDGIIPELDPKQFYERLRAGALPITQQANPHQTRKLLDRFLAEGKDILHLAFSSGLSGTYQSACMAATELREVYPDRKIVVVDTLCASMGEGLMVCTALAMQQQGSTLEEIAQWVTDNRLRLVHDVMADDLHHLHRGGRVSKATALVGTALGIKPLICVDNEGKLIAYNKVRGKRAALSLMADNLAKRIDRGQKNGMIFISHSDALEDAQLLVTLIRAKKTGIEDFLISFIGPTIGTHTGPGTVALFYFGMNRNAN